MFTALLTVVHFCGDSHKLLCAGSGDGSVVRATDQSSKNSGFESRQEQRENCLLQGELGAESYFGIRSTRVTAVASKRSRSFCQKCR